MDYGANPDTFYTSFIGGYFEFPFPCLLVSGHEKYGLVFRSVGIVFYLYGGLDCPVLSQKETIQPVNRNVRREVNARTLYAKSHRFRLFI